MGIGTLLFDGLSLGSIYALVAFGFVAVFKTNRILNFAHAPIGVAGALVMTSMASDGAYGLSILAGRNPLLLLRGTTVGWVLSLLVAIVCAGLMGMAVERIAVRPMRGRPAFIITTVTIGVSIVVQRLMDQAPISRRFAVPWGLDVVRVFGVDVKISTLVPVGLAAAVLGGLALFDKTGFGIAARALAGDEEAALAQGIPRGRVTGFAWALAAVLGTLAALCFSIAGGGIGAVSTAAAPASFFRAVPVLALGGWDSYQGVYVAGVFIGLVQVLSGGLLAPYTSLLGAGYSTILPYLIMVAVLLVRPNGLFGQGTTQRV